MAAPLASRSRSSLIEDSIGALPHAPQTAESPVTRKIAAPRPALTNQAVSKRHILFLRRSRAVGGVERRLLDWLQGIDYNKCRVTLACSADLFSARIKRLGLPVVSPLVHQRVSGPIWEVFFSWVSNLREMRPDQIILVDGYFLDWPLAVVAAAYFVSRGNLYMTEHLASPEPPQRYQGLHLGFLPGFGLRQRFLMSRLRWRAHLSRRVLAVSQDLKDWIVRNYCYDPAKITVAYHGVDTSRFCRASAEHRKALRSSIGVPEDSTVIVSTARLDKQKRLDRLIEAFRVLVRTHPNLWLLLAGDGSQEAELRRLAGSSGKSDRIRFLGWLEDVSPLLQAADIFALPSDFEGFGLAILEAMASELICVVTNTQGPGEIITDGEYGFLVEPSDEGIQKGLRKALALSATEREAMAGHARQRVVKRFGFLDGIRRGLEVLDLPIAETDEVR